MRLIKKDGKWLVVSRLSAVQFMREFCFVRGMNGGAKK